MWLSVLSALCVLCVLSAPFDALLRSLRSVDESADAWSLSVRRAG
jgi:hypothetical protein